MRIRVARSMLIALAAGVVLTGPGIRDNAERALWIVLGLAAILACWFLLVRRGRLQAGE